MLANEIRSGKRFGICPWNQDVMWRLKDGILWVTGNGFFDPNPDDEGINAYIKTCVPEETVKKVIIHKGIRVIGMGSFFRFRALEEVIIVGSLWEIADGAFWGCENLKAVKFLSSGPWQIRSNVFRDCRRLEKIALPDGIERLDPLAFAGTAIEEAQQREGALAYYVDGWLTQVKSISETFCVKPGTKGIATGLFKNCTPLKQVDLGNTVEILTEDCFANCTNLRKVSGCRGLVKLLPRAFGGCTALSELDRCDKLEYIGSYGFSRTALTKFDFPAVKRIRNNAFYQCANLREVSLPQCVDSVGSEAFEETPFFEDESNWKDDVICAGDWILAAKKSINGRYVVPANIHQIAEAAFCNCQWLKEVVFHSSVQNIENQAFLSSGLVIARLPPVKRIPSSCFKDCQNLEKVEFTEGTEYIERRAFSDCKNLVFVKIPLSVKAVDVSAFDNCPKMIKITDLRMKICLSTDNT